jgi:hypothetical protein
VSYFIFPQNWIAPAIAAAALAFGSLGDTTRVVYRNLSGTALGEARVPRTIAIDKRPASEWPKSRAQCVMVHEYAHLRGYHNKSNKADPQHSTNPNSIMYPVLSPKPCLRWLKLHGLGE